MATIPGLGGRDRSETQIDPAVQAERDKERLVILRQEQADPKYSEDVRAAVGREIAREGAQPAAPVPLEAPQQRYPAVPVDPAYEELKRRYAAAAAKTQPPDGMVGLYGRQLDAAMQRRLEDPGPAPEAGWDTWANAKALFGSGPVRGALEFAGSVADLDAAMTRAGASQRADDIARRRGLGLSTEPAGPLQLADDVKRSAEASAAARSVSAGPALRAKANEWAPDPLTAHRSTEIISGLSAGLTKAVGSAVTFGPLPGAVVFGAEEGNTAAQGLIESGVDAGTAAKVGAVVGVASTVGAALPVAGGTWLKTAALAAVGGPGTFVAQEALSRKILQEAAYTAQAEMHDPTDPVMIALSTAIPGAVGSIARLQAVRAAARLKAMQPVRDAVQVEADAQKLADVAGIERPGEVTISDATAPQQPTEAQIDAAARTAAGDLVAVDAARVRALDAAENRHIPPETPHGNEAGIDSVRAAVESGDMAPMKAMVTAQESAAVKAPPPLPEGVTVRPTPAGFEAVNADGALVGRLKSNLTPEQSKALGETANIDYVESDKSVRGTGVGAALYRAWSDAHEGRVAPSGKTTADAWRVWKRDYPEKVEAFAEQEAARIKDGADRRMVIGNITDADVAARVRTLVDAAPGEAPPAAVRVATARAGDTPEPAAVPRDISDWEAEGGRPSADGPLPGVRFGDAGAATKIDPATAAAESATYDAKSVTKLEQAAPDMVVTLPGHEAPMRLADAMELVRAQAQEMRQEGDLFTAAAECLLMSGL